MLMIILLEKKATPPIDDGQQLDNIDEVAIFRQSQRVCRPSTPNDYVMYLQEHKFDFHDDDGDLITFQETISNGCEYDFSRQRFVKDVYMVQYVDFVETRKKYLVCKLKNSIYTGTKFMLNIHFDMKDVGFLDDQKFTYNFIFIMTLTTTSTMEIEYVTCYEATRHTMSVVIYYHNTINLLIQKHFDIKYLFVKEKILNFQTWIKHLVTKNMLTNPLTKALTIGAFLQHIVHIGLVKTFDILG
ncbi:hypothetical protein CR513_38826, partial [Mucuna pruriens]